MGRWRLGGGSGNGHHAGDWSTFLARYPLPPSFIPLHFHLFSPIPIPLSSLFQIVWPLALNAAVVGVLLIVFRFVSSTSLPFLVLNAR